MKKMKILKSTGLIVTTFLSACFTANHESKLGDFVEKPAPNPVVEAFVEFVGPHRKWLGPEATQLHVVLKGGQKPSISFSPERLSGIAASKSEGSPEHQKAIAANAGPNAAPADAKRNPAEVVPTVGTDSIASDPTSDKIRAALDELTNSAFSEANNLPPKGCLYPVRLRLVRTDGTLLEKEGCRGGAAWVRKAEEFSEWALLIKSGKS